MIPRGTILRKRYQIIKGLGSGGFGDTYLATDLDLPGKPHCVVKHLKPKDNRPHVLALARKLFDTEAKVLYNLGNQSPQIPTLFAHFEENGEFYLVQEFIEGHDLSKEILTDKKLSESYVITLLKSILEVLAVAHEHQPNAIVHRDIKPANLMRRKDGKIILIDFGAVREINQLIVNANGDVTTTIAIGTSGYAPSEQTKGKPKLCSDVYAVGMIGIQALIGIPPQHLPEDASNGEVIWRHFVPKIDPKLADVLEKMVRDRFNERYQNAGEALQAILSLSPSLPPLPSQPPNLISTNTIPPPSPSSQPPNPISTNTTPPRVPHPPSQPPNLISTNTTPLPPLASQPPNLISTNQTRRGFLQFAGCAGVALVASVVGGVVSKKLRDKSAQTSNGLKTFNFETVTVNSIGQIANRRQGQAQIFTENIGNGVSLDMVAIPGGSFMMGSPNTEAGRSNHEEPPRTVNISPFFIGKYEVTQEQYQAVMGNNRSYFKGAKIPVEQVSWKEAVEFCRKLSQKTGKTYRLPSEAEWEYACRAGTTIPFYFGDTITPDLVNYDGNNPYDGALKGVYRKQTKDVGSFPPNAFGLYDMHGQVWEWCSDRYHDNYNGAPTDGSSWETGLDNRRVLRGGSWDDKAVNCRSASRDGNVAGFRYSRIGFRVAIVLA